MKIIASVAIVLGVVIYIFLPKSQREAHVFVDDKTLNGTKFLVAGQSNSVSPANGAPPIFSRTGKTKINDPETGASMKVPTSLTPQRTGLTWIYLGDMANREMAFNIVGIGNTSSRSWATTHKAGGFKIEVQQVDDSDVRS